MPGERDGEERGERDAAVPPDRGHPPELGRGATIGVRAQIACLAELAAPNPGNVRPGHDLPGLTAGEMTRSAAAIGPAMSGAGDVPLGRTILRAIRATRRWVDSNTNLGIVLLLAPVARAAALALADGGQPRAAGDPAPSADAPPPSPEARVPRGGAGSLDETALWEQLEQVLEASSVDDARLAYRAIRLAEPGGLGRVGDQDVSGTPTVPLRDAMARAADRDAVAEQYATGYELLRTTGLPAVRSARAESLTWEDAAHRCFVLLLAERPDSLVARKFGREAAEELQEAAERLLAVGPPEATDAAEGWSELDRRLRSSDPPRNPGTTADLTAAALFLALLLDVGWNSPADGQ